MAPGSPFLKRMKRDVELSDHRRRRIYIETRVRFDESGQEPFWKNTIARDLNILLSHVNGLACGPGSSAQMALIDAILQTVENLADAEELRHAAVNPFETP